MILPAQILDVPVRQPARDVAGAIDSFAGVDGLSMNFSAVSAGLFR